MNKMEMKMKKRKRRKRKKKRKKIRNDIRQRLMKCPMTNEYDKTSQVQSRREFSWNEHCVEEMGLRGNWSVRWQDKHEMEKCHWNLVHISVGIIIH